MRCLRFDKTGPEACHAFTARASTTRSARTIHIRGGGSRMDGGYSSHHFLDMVRYDTNLCWPQNKISHEDLLSHRASGATFDFCCIGGCLHEHQQHIHVQSGPSCWRTRYVRFMDSQTCCNRLAAISDTLSLPGYYTVEECGDVPNPTLGMRVGETYTFVQKDRSNYYHPIGFAYEADGAHADVDELEPGISRGTSDCASDLQCPAPMYFLNGNYLGEYSNIPEVLNNTGSENFGLDDYEPLFFHPLADWVGLGEFSVQLRFDDDTFTQDIFYFCHVRS